MRTASDPAPTPDATEPGLGPTEEVMPVEYLVKVSSVFVVDEYLFSLWLMILCSTKHWN